MGIKGWWRCMKIKNEAGSITLEAAIAICITISVVLTISFFGRVVYVHGIIQNALIQTANEMSVYSYLYSMAGINEINDVMNARNDASRANFNTSLNEMKNFYDELTALNLSGLEVPNIDGSILGDAAGSLESVVFDSIKTQGVNELLTKHLVKRYIPKAENPADDFLAKNNVVGGMGGLDYSASRYFNSDAPDCIHLVVSYQIKFVSPIPVIDTLPVVQGAKVRCWFKAPPSTNPEADPEENPEADRGIWSLASTARGRQIIEAQSYSNLATNFKKLKGFSGGTAFLATSIDLCANTYEGNKSAIKSRITSELNGISQFRADTKNGVTVRVEDIRTVESYIYIPPDASPADVLAAQECAMELSENTVTLADGRRVPVRVQVVTYQ